MNPGFATKNCETVDSLINLSKLSFLYKVGIILYHRVEARTE